MFSPRRPRGVSARPKDARISRNVATRPGPLARRIRIVISDRASVTGLPSTSNSPDDPIDDQGAAAIEAAPARCPQAPELGDADPGDQILRKERPREIVEVPLQNRDAIRLAIRPADRQDLRARVGALDPRRHLEIEGFEIDDDDVGRFARCDVIGRKIAHADLAAARLQDGAQQSVKAGLAGQGEDPGPRLRGVHRHKPAREPSASALKCEVDLEGETRAGGYPHASPMGSRRSGQTPMRAARPQAGSPYRLCSSRFTSRTFTSFSPIKPPHGA